MNPTAGYEHPEVGEVITEEFVFEYNKKWVPVKFVMGTVISATFNLKDWARPKNKHWNSVYSDVKRPYGFRFLDEGEIIEKGDKFINTLGDSCINSVGEFSIGAEANFRRFPIIRQINKTSKPKKKTALQLANEKVAALTKELEELKRKIKDLAAKL